MSADRIGDGRRPVWLVVYWNPGEAQPEVATFADVELANRCARELSWDVRIVRVDPPARKLAPTPAVIR